VSPALLTNRFTVSGTEWIRRMYSYGHMKRALLRNLWVAGALGSVACSTVATPPPTPAIATVVTCNVTIAHLTPPAEVFDFFVQGSTSPNAREAAKTLNWFGNDAMWVVLPADGATPPGMLGDKIPPYRLKPGQVEWHAHRVDAAGPDADGRIGGASYGDIGFAAGGPEFPTVGCWEVTYTLDGRDPLRFVLRVT
jgi:hypothetical protein